MIIEAATNVAATKRKTERKAMLKPHVVRLRPAVARGASGVAKTVSSQSVGGKIRHLDFT
jgi:hypothetical protein